MSTSAGIDRFLAEGGALLQGRRAVLVTAAANVDGSGRPVLDGVAAAAGDRLTAVWSLQHGFFADRQDNMVLSASFRHPRLGIPVRSLYGDHLLPPDDWLEGIDVLLVDVFDVGTRVYTFLNHLVMVMRRLSGRGIAVIVLDRPNPLGGVLLEGPPADPAWFSLVGQLPLPMRHGLTAGEFLAWGREYYRVDLDLQVVTADGWSREREFSGIWTYPSPNMPGYPTARLYPGAVMLEGTNLSEGRGTTRPFELAGAPWLDAPGLAGELQAAGYRDLVMVPLGFQPEFGKFAGERCAGLLVSPGRTWDGRAFGFYYDLIRLARRRHPREFAWKPPPYEFEYHRPPVDMICGGPSIREWIEADRPFREVAPEINAALAEYREAAVRYHLYP